MSEEEVMNQEDENQEDENQEDENEEEVEQETPKKNFESLVGKTFNKKYLVENIIEFQPIYYDNSRNWWLWNWSETKWERVDETDVLNAIEKQATINTISSKEKNELLEALKQVSRRKENTPIPIKPTWIQFKDKIVDIQNGKTFDVKPYWFVTNPIPWELHENNYTDTPTLDSIFEEWVGQEYVQTLYEIISYCLIPSYPIHRIFCLIGNGLNGKTCFLNLLRDFLGQKNCCSTELDILLTSRFEVTRLHKKLVCIMGETNFNEISKTSILKKLSGGDLIGFEYKNKDPFDDVNYAKIIIATNNLPTTTDKTMGFYRRWLIIDFPNQFNERSDILSTIPPEEFNSLALKCTHILYDLLKERTFTNEGSLEERQERYEQKSDFLGGFVKRHTEVDNDEFITSSEFYRKFSQWCKENKYREMSETSVGIRLKKLGWEKERKYLDWLYNGKGGQVWCWVGQKWKN